MATKSLTIEILGDSRSAQRAFKDVDQTQETFGKKLGGLAKSIGGLALVGGIAAFGKASVSAGTDAAESLSKVGVVFGASGAKVEQFAATSAKALGQSRQDVLAAAGTFGNLAVSLGLPQEKAADMSTTLVGLASDMASFNNVSPEEALEALRSGLVGETEPLRKFGVNLNDAALQAKALAMGIGDGKAPLSAAAKAQASYALIMEQSKTAQGDFARTAGGLANQKRILAAQVEDLQAKVGEKLVPALVKVANVGMTVLTWVQNMSPGMQQLLLVGAGLIGLIVAVVKVTQMWAAVQGAFNVVMAMNPVVLVVLAIVALIAVVVLAYQRVDWFRSFVDGAFRMIGAVIGGVVEWVRANWPLLIGLLTGPVGVAVLMIVRHWDTIKAAFSAVVGWIGARVGDVVGFFVGWHRRSMEVVGAVWGFLRDGASNAVRWVADRLNDLVGFYTGMPGRLWNAARGMWDGLVSGFRSAVNWIIRAWNGLEFRVPGFSVGPVSFGGFTLGMPDVPYLAKGGNVVGRGLAVVGERGPELVDLNAGARVTPLTGGVGGGLTVPVRVDIDGREVAKATVRFTREELLRMQKGRQLGFGT